jgi:hypothetical protein
MPSLQSHSASCKITLEAIPLNIFYTYTSPADSQDSEKLCIDGVYLQDSKIDIYDLFYTSMADLEEEVYSILESLPLDMED